MTPSRGKKYSFFHNVYDDSEAQSASCSRGTWTLSGSWRLRGWPLTGKVVSQWSYATPSSVCLNSVDREEVTLTLREVYAMKTPRTPKQIYLLTYSMVQSPSSEANWFAASQKIPRISWNPKVHYRTHKRPPPISILSQLNPVHIPTSHLLEIHPNIIHPSTPRSPHWSPSLPFPHQDSIHPPLSLPKTDILAYNSFFF